MKQVIHILLVEDDTLDQIDVKRTLERRKILHRLTILKNGEEMIDVLQKSLNDPSLKPNVILLDLNLPRINGVEVLSIVRSHPSWDDVKIFVLTTSDEQSDKDAVAPYRISGYLIKPLKLENPSSIDSFNLMIDLMNL